MRNRQEKTKCKEQETTIGKIIYGFLLFMPLLAIFSAIIISTFNEGLTSLDEQEVFYTAITNVTNSTLFNWSQNSIIYTTTANTCTALSITTPFIPLLMSYWLIISILYFLYDIALMLVWAIHKKVHELQESI